MGVLGRFNTELKRCGHTAYSLGNLLESQGVNFGEKKLRRLMAGARVCCSVDEFFLVLTVGGLNANYIFASSISVPENNSCPISMLSSLLREGEGDIFLVYLERIFKQAREQPADKGGSYVRY